MSTALINVLLIIFVAIGSTYIYANEKLRRAVSLEFEEVEGATSYQIRIIRILPDGSKKKPIFFKVNEPKWSAQIVPGKYHLEMRSFDDREVPGDWSEPAEFWVKIPAPVALNPKVDEVIKTNDEEDYDIKFKWQALENTERYLLEVTSEDGKINKKEVVSDTDHEFNLPVAQKYNWKVTAMMGDGSLGEPQEKLNTFTLIAKKLDAPEIEAPISIYVSKLKWSKPERSQTFDYAILQKTKDQKWKTVEKKSNIPANEIKYDLSKPPGNYKLLVKAKAKYTEDSKTESLEFEAAGNLRSPAAIQEAILKDSLKKPTPWYGIASYFLTSMTYSGQDYVNEEVVAFSAIGGNGRLGLGYQKPKSKLGYYGVADMAGFTVDGQNITFPSIELHVTYEPWKFDASQLLLSGGFFHKDLPEIKSGKNGQLVGSIEMVSLSGLHAGFKYWTPFTQKLGVQVNARVYTSLSTSTPLGEGSGINMNYQFGVLGSYRLSQKAMGFAGYAYRDDKANYTATGQTQSNLVQITGHYLNLILEYSF